MKRRRLITVALLVGAWLALLASLYGYLQR